MPSEFSGVTKMAGKKVGNVKRKAGHLYYVTGTGAVMETKLSRKGPKKVKKAKKARKKKS
jgi:hypothetical protein